MIFNAQSAWPSAMVRTLLIAALASGGAAAIAQQTLVAAQSDIAFGSKQMGANVEGRFKKFDAQVAFDPKKPEAAKIGIAIDLGSVSLGSTETEKELVKPEWFNLKLFPQATFISSVVRGTTAGKFEISGKLAIKGVSRDVVVPVTLTQAGGSTTAVGSFVIKRLDFKIGDGDWNDPALVANDVHVKFKLVLSGVPNL